MSYLTEFRFDDGVWGRIPGLNSTTINESMFPIIGDEVVGDGGKVYTVSRRMFDYGHHTTITFYCKPRYP